MPQGKHSNDYAPFVLRGCAGHQSTDFPTLEDSCFDYFQSLSSRSHPYYPGLIIHTFASCLTHSAGSTNHSRDMKVGIADSSHPRFSARLIPKLELSFILYVPAGLVAESPGVLR